MSDPNHITSYRIIVFNPSLGQINNRQIDVLLVSCIYLTTSADQVTPGGGLAQEYKEENVELLSQGLVHLTKQIGNVTQFGTPCVVAVNRLVVS